MAHRFLTNTFLSWNGFISERDRGRIYIYKYSKANAPRKGKSRGYSQETNSPKFVKQKETLKGFCIIYAYLWNFHCFSVSKWCMRKDHKGCPQEVSWSSSESGMNQFRYYSAGLISGTWPHSPANGSGKRGVAVSPRGVQNWFDKQKRNLCHCKTNI